MVIGCLLTGRLNRALLAAAAVPAAVGLNDGLCKPWSTAPTWAP